jgi:nicotinamide mononucleotide transporter
MFLSGEKSPLKIFLDMIYISFIVSILFIISLYYSAKNNKISWIYGFVGNTLLAIILFQDCLYTSFLFRIYSIITCIIGFFMWNNKKSKIIKGNMIFPIINSILLGGLIYYFNKTISNNAIIDSIGTSLCIIATYLLMKRDINNWKFWIISDSLYIYMGILMIDIKYIIMYVSMLILSIYGLINFKKEYGKKS